MLTRHFASVLAFFAWAAVSNALAQTSSTIAPIADAFVTTGPADDRRSNNYGAAGALSVAARSQPQGEFLSLLKFNLASTVAFFNATYGAGQWAFASATLQLSAVAPDNAIFNPSNAGTFGVLWQLKDAWIEGTGTPGAPTTDGVTFASLPSAAQSEADTALGTFTYNGATTGTFFYNLSLATALTNDMKAGGDVSFRVIVTDPNVSFLFGSREHATTSLRPMLTVAAVPEPSVVLLLIVGGAAAARHLRRR